MKVEIGIVFLNEQKCRYRKKTNDGQMKWIVQRNEKIVF